MLGWKAQHWWEGEQHHRRAPFSEKPHKASHVGLYLVVLARRLKDKPAETVTHILIVLYCTATTFETDAANS